MAFLQSGGEMGQLIRQYDWSQTSIGSFENWPATLRSTLMIMLHSRFPMFLFWGEELLCFYNDAYRPSLGANGKHPWALGKPGKEVWAEIWKDLEPMLEKVKATGEPNWNENQLLPIYRNGHVEEVYWTFSHSPLYDDAGKVAGIFTVCNETTDRVNNLKSLNESNDQLQFAIEAAELATWDYNPITDTFTANDRLKDWFGITGNREVLLSEAINAMAEEDRERVAALIRDSLQFESGGSYETEYTLVNVQNGTRRFIRARGRAWFDENKIAYRLNGTLEDITAETKARKQIEASEQYFRSLTESVPSIIWITNALGYCTYLNSKWYEFTGQLKQEAIGEGWTGAVHPEDREHAFSVFIEANTKQQAFKNIYRLKTEVDGYRWVVDTGKPRYNDIGEYEGMVGTVADIHEQKLAEERTRLAVAASELGMYEIDLKTSKVEASPRFNEIFDVSDAVPDHRYYIESIHPDDRDNREKAHLLAYETGHIFYEARVIKKNGATHWIRVKGRVDYDETGIPSNILGVVQDITEQKELERQKDSFLGIASHELKTPVTSVKGYTQFLERKFRRQGDDASADLLIKMNTQLNRLSLLIGDLLDVTKINNGRLLFTAAPFDFNQMVEEVIDEMQRSSDKHNIRKQLNFNGLVNSDRERVCQVVINLISNAIKYSPDANRIIVFTEQHGNEVQLCVQDFGIGISQDKKDQVFEQFYRVSGTLEHTFPGLGLGLYISSEIVKRLKGRIWVNSVEGKGSTFCFAIPIGKNN